MSLITRCPACTTMFKVVPDQLRVSDGWVRCGQCSEVFDANANLQDAAGEALKPHVPDSLVVHSGPAAHKAAVEAIEATESSDAPQPEPFLEVSPNALHIEPQDPVAELAKSGEPPDDPMPSAPAALLPEQSSPSPEDVPTHSF